MAKDTDYRTEAISDAADTADYFINEIVEALIDKREASDDLLNDYPNGDSYHHESHVDKWYCLSEAAALLDELDEYEETDSGLWEGQEPREAISTQAAFTYGGAVYSLFVDLIKEINGDDDVSEIIDEYEAAENDDSEPDDDAKEERTEAKQEAIKAKLTARVNAIIKGFRS